MATTTLIETDRAKALGALLKHTRSSLPAETISRSTARRRVPGLRREEVAAAAGISATWYTWLEQGRTVSCSRATLGRIAAALRMDRTERRHLFDLANLNDDGPVVRISTAAPSTLTPIVDALRYEPAYLINAVWDVLHCNAACDAVLGRFDSSSHITGNVLRRLFLDEHWRNRFADWEATAQSAVAQFRGATGALHGIDEFMSLVGSLADESLEFRAMWERKRLAPSPVKLKTFVHPTAGPLRLHYASMRPDSMVDDVSIVIYAPVAESFGAVRSLVGG